MSRLMHSRWLKGRATRAMHFAPAALRWTAFTRKAESTSQTDQRTSDGPSLHTRTPASKAKNACTQTWHLRWLGSGQLTHVNGKKHAHFCRRRRRSLDNTMMLKP